MSTKLKVKIGKHPNPEALLSTKEIQPSKRILRTIFGTTKPRHKMAIILPGTEATSVEIQHVEPDDDLMALAHAVGVAGSGGDRS
ncbi:hypothetical protein [Arcanobacterium hippocoleae]|uniref:Uncharacterized protein n=1 Tax=Arcanobacterium hippocoleae TaxID=149017 RepID=A0ABU1SZZ0_9ACTO|nr:hypothetical protein [Arcanobacterium hippocoleae]MDR6938673.1 hypothetical protein [Arcanobacterium hippocoleae]